MPATGSGTRTGWNRRRAAPVEPERDPDARWVAALTGAELPAAHAAIAAAAGEHRLFGHLVRQHRKEGRSSYVEIAAPLELHAMVRLLRPEHVVEVGVSSGVSSAYLLQALEENGTGLLHSVDLPSRPRPGVVSRESWSLPPGRGTGWAVPERLWRRWDLRIGDKADVLPFLADQLPRIDLFVYDVPHDDRETRRELARLEPRLGRGSVVLIDHGPNGGTCAALRAWARRWGGSPLRREGLGLAGIRRPTVVTAARSMGETRVG
jgi:hypothetical protein